jgi:N-acetylglucosaminyldiphosphoundecaprenol N-acetyl-beta-D-mannosaminyltransferase
MVVGGVFSYISGKSKLPSKWMEKVGLEWIWRLITEPKRIKRIFNAIIIFPLLVFKKKLR